jgi:hypothetical protein
MKTTNRILSAVVAMGVIATVVLLALGVAGPAFSTASLTALLRPAGAQTPPPGDVIPLQPISGLTSLNATVKLDVNGLINGKRAQGDLNGLLTTNDQGKSKVTVSGSLLGDIVAQVGGSLVGLFTPSKVDLYKVPDGAYVVVNGLFPVCVKPDAADATAALDELSPSSMLNMLTGSDVARGTFVGDETLNGVPVKRYVIDGDSFLVAAQNSSDKKLKAFGDALWSAKDADLYVDAKGGYPVAFRGSYSGAFEPLKFEGDFGVDIQLTDVNTNTRVDLPAACNKPISPR